MNEEYEAPLGGEPETLAVVTLGCFSSEELGDIDIEPQMSVLERIQQELVKSDSDEHLELIDRVHFDKSQLEIERLKSEAEENHKEREVICSNYDQLKARCDELERLCIDSREASRVPGCADAAWNSRHALRNHHRESNRIMSATSQPRASNEEV